MSNGLTLSLGEVIQLISVVLVLGGMFFGLYRWVVAMLADQRKSFSGQVAELHGRIDSVRDEYVRRRDLDDHIARIEKSQDKVIDGQERIHTRIDELLAQLVGDRP